MPGTPDIAKVSPALIVTERRRNIVVLAVTVPRLVIIMLRDLVATKAGLPAMKTLVAVVVPKGDAAWRSVRIGDKVGIADGAVAGVGGEVG